MMKNATWNACGRLRIEWVGLLALLVLGTPLVAQTSTKKVKKKDNDPVVKELSATLAKFYKSKNDTSARSMMRDLLNKAAEAGPKDMRRISDVLARAFKQRRKDKSLYVAAAAALGAIGPAGAKPLIDAFRNKTFKKDRQMLKMFAIEIGKTLDKKGMAFAIDLLDFKFYEVIAGAAEGLSHYHAAKLATRKEIVKNLVRSLESAANTARDPENSEAQRKYAMIGGPLIDALQKLTGQNLRQPLEWTKWWNKNKKAKDW